MASMNLVALIGNLTRDPQLSYTSGNMAVCEFGIAINEKRKGQEKVHFIDCKAFDKSAEFVNQYFRKGKAIQIIGKLAYSSWVTTDGQKRSKVEVIANDVSFAGGREDGEGATPRQPSSPRPARSAPRREEPEEDPNLPPSDADSDIPF